MFKETIAREVREQLENSLWGYEKRASRRLEAILGTAVGIVNDTVVLAPGKEYELLNTRIQHFEFVQGVLDLSGLKDGDIVEIEVSLRFPDGELKRWRAPQYAGVVADPALALEPLLCPAGAKINAKHIAGQSFPLHYYLVRRR